MEICPKHECRNQVAKDDLIVESVLLKNHSMILVIVFDKGSHYGAPADCITGTNVAPPETGY
jgi:hypothetical protein